jgi:hypothetical protein
MKGKNFRTNLPKRMTRRLGAVAPERSENLVQLKTTMRTQKNNSISRDGLRRGSPCFWPRSITGQFWTNWLRDYACAFRGDKIFDSDNLFLMRDLALFRAKSTGRLRGFEPRRSRQSYFGNSLLKPALRRLRRGVGDKIHPFSARLRNLCAMAAKVFQFTANLRIGLFMCLAGLRVK